MKSLSISAAWDETRAILARDGRLYISVALALVALPTAINSLINPGGMNGRSTPLWIDGVTLLVSLTTLAGQLALIRLALGPSVTVGGAIGHGVRRLPIYLLSVLIIVAGFVLLLVLIGVLLAALGLPVQRQLVLPLTPGTVIAVILFLVIVFYFGVRLILTSTVASAEEAGPIAILRHSWRLTAGHWWRLFGFLFTFLLGAIILLIAIGSAAGVAIGLLVGSIQPMSAGALVLALVQALVSAAVTTLFAVMLARIYAQLVGRGEAQAGVPRSGT
jgi:hypothetical protein